MLREQANKVSVLPRIADLACVATAFVGALIVCGFRDGMGPMTWLAQRSSALGSGALVTDEYLLFLFVSIVAWEAAGQSNGVYRSYRTERVWVAFRSQLRITVVWAMLLASFLYLFKLTSITRPFFLTFFSLAISLLSARLIGVLALLHHFRARGYNLRRVAVLGETERVAHFTRFIEEEAGTGLRVMEPQPINNRGDMFALANPAAVDEIVFILSGSDGTQELERAVLKLVRLGKQVHIIPGLFDSTLFRQGFGDFAGIPVLSVGGCGLDKFQAAAKRIMDVVGSLVGLVLLSPIIGLVAIAVKLSSPGPVLFHQKRLGQNGKRFWILKFRTMYKDAEIRLKRDPVLNDKHIANNYKLPKGEDPRVTKIGALLRATSLDELPQLINVLKGNMSLVGPRPVVPPEIEEYGEYAPLLLSVKPGLTGYWQVQGRSEVTDYARRTTMDIEYVRDQSLKTDINIMLKTIPAVLRRKGAH